jgi:hypothetical protein
VKHLSLAWHESEKPTREHMIETAQAYLKHMRWGDRQAILYCHNDTPHPHVHVVINSVSPDDGRALDTRFERERSQAFALQYERLHGKIFCEERLQPKPERRRSPDRKTWQKLRESEKQHDKVEAARVAETPDYFERADPALRKEKEWEFLKAQQRQERTDFFAEGKQAFKEVRNEIYRAVRAEFRDEWKAFYHARREGLDPERLAEIKADILERQNAMLDARRTAACDELRERRDADYAELLLRQKEERAELRARQAEGLASPSLLDQAHEQIDQTKHQVDKQREAQDRENARDETRKGFEQAAGEVTEKGRDEEEEREERREEPEREEAEPFEQHGHESFRVRSGVDILGGIGGGIIGGLSHVAEQLLEGFFDDTRKPRSHQPPKPDLSPPSVQKKEQARARATENELRKTEAQMSEVEQLQAYWEERRPSRGRERD